MLGVLLAFGALNAFAGGIYGIGGAPNVPVEWLEGSRFTDYRIPSLILVAIVGDALLVAAIAVFARVAWGWVAAATAGAVVLGWIGAQVAIIGYVSWMQPVTAIAGLVVLWLALRLPVSAPRDAAA